MGMKTRVALAAVLLPLALYQCLDRRVPPSITKGPETTDREPLIHRLFQIDDLISLPCVATGVPRVEYRWYVDGYLMVLNSRLNIHFDPVQPETGSIVIHPVYSFDEGHYQCRAENEHGVALSQVVFLQRVRLDPFPGGSAKDYPVTEGEALMLPCRGAISIPVPNYFWSTTKTIDVTGSTHVTLNKRINIDEEGNLYFSYVKPEDAKNGYVYRCNVFNPVLDVQRGGSYAKINVINYPAAPPLLPKIMYHTADVIAIKGREQRLKCLFQGKPEVSISWGRDTSVGLPLYHKVQSYTTELVIYPVALDDEAVYTCTGNNALGSTRQNINVKVGAKPEFERRSDRPRDMNFAEGDSAEIRCWAYAIPVARVQWFINGRRFEEVNPGSRYQISADGKTLTIEDVCKDCRDRKSDIQNIQCNASNVHGYAYGGGYINVLRSTVIAPGDGPVDAHMARGGRNFVILNCFATSDESTPVSYRWLHNEKEVDYIADVIWMAENSSLIIQAEDDKAIAEYIGMYICVATNGYSTATAAAFVKDNYVSSNITKGRTTIIVGPADTDMKYGEVVLLNCLATSDDNASILYRWYLDGKPIDYVDTVIWGDKHSLLIRAENKETAETYVGNYTCEASNGYSSAFASAIVKLPSAESMTPTARAFAAVAGIFVLLLLVGVSVIYRRRCMCAGNIKTQNGDTNFEAAFTNETANAGLDQLLRSTFDDDVLFKLNKLRLPRNCITLAQQIGKGAFGMVWKAVYHKGEHSRIVAAKTVQGSRGDIEDVIPVLSEALVMGELSHRHVMGLLGVVIDEEPLLVLPFMRNGDLHSYLRSSRFGDSTDIKPVEPHQLMVFGRQIARGMEYLGSQRVIHRDLACRNCMLNANLVVKVADFGLSKDVHETNYYRQVKESRLPIKWLAVESLVDRVFTTQSDVWAYGVTLWEVLTMARTPYPSLDNSEVLNYVKTGGRLEQPEDCPDQIFPLMTRCWDPCPSKRPTFSELAENIDQHLAEEMGYLEVAEPDDDESCLPLLYEIVDGESNNGGDEGLEDRAPDGDGIVVLNPQANPPGVET